MKVFLVIFSFLIVGCGNPANLDEEVETSIEDHGQASVFEDVNNRQQSESSVENTEFASFFERIPVADYNNFYDSETMRYSWATLDDGCRVREAVLIRDAEDVIVSGDCQIEYLIMNELYTGVLYEYDRESDGNTVELDIEHVHPWALIVRNMSPALYEDFVAERIEETVAFLYNWDASLNATYGLNVQYSNLLSADPMSNRIVHSDSKLNEGWVSQLDNGNNVRCFVATVTLQTVADMNNYLANVNIDYHIGMSEEELLWIDLALQECGNRTETISSNMLTVSSTTSTIPVEASTSSSTTVGQGSVYANCAAVRAAGVAPIRSGDPGWDPKFDRDGDGVGCE